MWRPRLCRLCLVVVAAGGAAGVSAQEAWQWSGFALARGATRASDPFDEDAASAQIQLGLDWSPSPVLLAHVHLLARTDAGDSEHGKAGTPEAYLELNLHPGDSRLRLRGGAFFLPTSRENVDALWENPYAISSSALNSWLGEELRPIGLDATFFHGPWQLGATVFRGNDTFGALPALRGFSLDDQWALLGQKTDAGGERYSSVSAETDRRLGWSARAGWNGEHLGLRLSHVDNRSDALAHGELHGWETRFEIVGFDATLGDWTIAGENGWGPTAIVAGGARHTSDLRAGYLLVSRRFARARLTLRLDAFAHAAAHDEALTLDGFWDASTRLRLGLELLSTRATARALVEARYRLGGR